uniref:Mitochondrial peptide methionine sulfoxide reductase n=1 Tax=Arion vulgaris TaxID=1028688 RepID=A0A0B7B8S9_9EUPU
MYKTVMVPKNESLPGRTEEMVVSTKHTVLGSTTVPPFPANMETALLGMGCFWGVEKKFWAQEGVFSTQAGYSGGFTPNPTYKEVCTGQTGHAEVVRIIYDPSKTSFGALLQVFWENHDPTQGYRQGRSTGTQYRSVIYALNNQQLNEAETTRNEYNEALSKEGLGPITTEILQAGKFYYAEDYHQQYLDKNKDGYCGVGGTGVLCPRRPIE